MQNEWARIAQCNIARWFLACQIIPTAMALHLTEDRPMIAHVISDFGRPQSFGDRLWALFEALCNKAQDMMTLPPEALPM